MSGSGTLTSKLRAAFPQPRCRCGDPPWAQSQGRCAGETREVVGAVVRVTWTPPSGAKE